jgi:mannose-6-phosphate isomerase
LALILKIENQALDYAWGSKTLISDFFAVPATGKPMAEIWFGTHPSNPARISGASGETLLQRLGHELPFMVKILAAGSPLSIQAHPNSKQAVRGFSRENTREIPLDAPNRNYRDDRHKPEIMVALIDGFEALAGFRPQLEIRELMTELETHGGELGEYAGTWKKQVMNLAEVFNEMLSLGRRAKPLIDELIAVKSENERSAAQIEIAKKIAVTYPADPGVLVTLLMNHVTLAAGEALALKPGQIHAYLFGIGVEVMASSDNVLRGGLTKKHVDLAELGQVLSFDSVDVSKITARVLARGLAIYESGIDDFLLYQVQLDSGTVLADLNLPGEGILLCTTGQLVVSNSIGETLTLRRGEAAYISDDAKLFTLSSNGSGFFVTASK